MGPQAGTPWPVRLCRVLLLLAALDGLAGGLWALLWPQALFDFLGMAARSDAGFWQLFTRDLSAPRDAGLWQVLGLLALANGAFLLVAAWRPRELGGLALVPLVGRALLAGLWLWALGTTFTFPERRVVFPDRTRLALLAAHDGAWAVVLAAFLVAWWAWPRGRGGKESAPRVE
jgi:hypothetical protein